MILAIIAALVCLAAAAVTFTPNLRGIRLLRPIAVYLIFQGVWILLSYALLQLNPNNAFVFPVNYIATILLIAYFIFVMIASNFKRKLKKEKKSKK